MNEEIRALAADAGTGAAPAVAIQRRRHDTQTPPEAFADALETRSYEAGRAGPIRVGTTLRYLESLATRASAALGFDSNWYAEQQVAWVVREMSLLLGDLPTIGDALTLATWVSDFKRVQAFREYVVARQSSQPTPRMVARARARWAYVDRASGRPLAIHAALTGRMGALGYTMRSRPQRFGEVTQALQRGATDGAPRLAPAGELALVAREYEADVNQHINNCVYADWLDEGLHQSLTSGRLAMVGVTPTATLRPRYYHLEYIRPLRPGARVTVRTYALGRRSRSLILWQEILADDASRQEATPTLALRAYSEHLLAPATA